MRILAAIIIIIGIIGLRFIMTDSPHDLGQDDTMMKQAIDCRRMGGKPVLGHGPAGWYVKECWLDLK